MKKMTNEMYAGGILEAIYTTLARLELYSSEVSAIVKECLVDELARCVDEIEEPVIQAYIDYIDRLAIEEYSDYVNPPEK